MHASVRAVTAYISTGIAVAVDPTAVDDPTAGTVAYSCTIYRYRSSTTVAYSCTRDI